MAAQRAPGRGPDGVAVRQSQCPVTNKSARPGASVLKGSPACGMTWHRKLCGELLQHTSRGVVLVVAAGLALVVSGRGRLVQHLWRDYSLLINR